MFFPAEPDPLSPLTEFVDVTKPPEPTKTVTRKIPFNTPSITALMPWGSETDWLNLVHVR